MASGAVSLYTMLFLGAFTPIHCRCTVAFGAILTVVMSFFAGFGLLFYCGFSYSNFHSWIPYLMMVIGVEHFFVICNAVDQTQLIHSSYQRIHEALSHAGPAITITSLTTALAFGSGMLSSLQALRSFCLFACVCIVMLWLASMTLFLAFVVWDTQRVEDKNKECCGACFCKEDSCWCCFGRLASKKQRKFSGMEEIQVVDISSARSNQPDLSGGDSEVEIIERSFKYKVAQKEIEQNSLAEKFCGMIVGPKLLSDVSRGIFVILYIIMIAGACYKAA